MIDQHTRDLMDGRLAPHGTDSRSFIYAIDSFSDYCHQLARGKGFWEDRDDLDSCGNHGRIANDFQMLMLMVTELAEAAEGLRTGNGPDDKVPEYSTLEAELADTVIRIFDMAHARGCRLGECIVAKMHMNEGRPRKHGKEC